ncbi:unnamed protein product [Cylindrotheca closterium]|uniref:Uncharacterized protein n=1 Tax=Cylindrotheca closterium TaxID=2856 RepID=A0AAD2CIR9_9STRA|nr:unnamed protein product [Cylindrotheca closterium]
MEVGGSSKSSATGKHKLKDDVMSLYLNHASTGNSYYQLIPECLDPIQPLDFLDIGRKLGSQKVMGNFELEDCLQEDKTNCARSNQIKETCRTWSFYYDSIYNHWLQPKLARDDAEPFQAVEIGFFHGIGHEALSQFLPKAQVHSLEISCLPEGPREEGKWPWGNFAANSNQYDNLISKKRLHCGDAYSYDFLHSTFSQHIHLPDAPPLRVVVEDGSYQSQDMAASLFFWFPRLEPGGMFFVEGIRPDDNGGHGPADQFKTHIVPQVMKDLHWCGHSSTEEPQTDGGGVKDPDLCFPQLQPYLQGVHCEMHICVFVRNNRPAADPPKELSTVPPNAFENASKCLFGR